MTPGDAWRQKEALEERVEKLERACLEAQWAMERLYHRADECHAGRIQGGGREWARAIWGSFSGFVEIVGDEFVGKFKDVNGGEGL